MGHTRKSSQEKEKGKWVGMGYGTQAKRHYPMEEKDGKLPENLNGGICTLDGSNT